MLCYLILYYVMLCYIKLLYYIISYIIIYYIYNTVFKKCPPKMISNDFIVTKARAAFSSCRVSSRASAKAYDKVWSTSKAVQSWCHSRNIVATYTSGSDWTSSGQFYNKNQHFKGTSTPMSVANPTAVSAQKNAISELLLVKLHQKQLSFLRKSKAGLVPWQKKGIIGS